MSKQFVKHQGAARSAATNAFTLIAVALLGTACVAAQPSPDAPTQPRLEDAVQGDACNGGDGDVDGGGDGDGDGNDAGLEHLRADKVSKIDALWADIAKARKSAGFVEELQQDAIEAMAKRPVASVRATCERPDDSSGRCKDVCKLSDSICNNADSICRLAGELGDDWGRSRCAKATAACAESAKRCCGCR